MNDEDRQEPQNRVSPPDIPVVCNALRAEAKILEKSARDMKDHPAFDRLEAFRGQHDEMRANIILAIRHLEDARMRLGKVIQYSGDGVSCYDK